MIIFEPLLLLGLPKFAWSERTIHVQNTSSSNTAESLTEWVSTCWLQYTLRAEISPIATKVALQYYYSLFYCDSDSKFHWLALTDRQRQQSWPAFVLICCNKTSRNPKKFVFTYTSKPFTDKTYLSHLSSDLVPTSDWHRDWHRACMPLAKWIFCDTSGLRNLFVYNWVLKHLHVT